MRYLITAGPTREAIDDVRYVSNRSSGKLGFAIAQAARAAGHQVVLVHGPVAIRTPAGLTEVVPIESARELHRECLARFEAADVAVMVAAVADYAPRRRHRGKLRRRGEALVLELAPTRDVCAALGRRKRADQTLVGFALEASDPGRRSALGKMRRKRCDLIVANSTATLDADEAALEVLDAGGVVARISGQKRNVARRLVKLIDAAARARRGGGSRGESAREA